MEPVKNPMMAATATKTAVQVPWSERAFRAVEILEYPAAATQIHPIDRQKPVPDHDSRKLTQHKSNAHELLAQLSAQLLTNVHDTVDLRVVTFEGTDHMVAPGDYASNTDQAEHTRYETKRVKCSGNG